MAVKSHFIKTVDVKMAVESGYGSVITRVVFTSKRMLLVAHKNILSTTLKNSVIYEYSCHCDSRYVGRTSQRLQDRIKQHVPKWLQQQAKWLHDLNPVDPVS